MANLREMLARTSDAHRALVQRMNEARMGKLRDLVGGGVIRRHRHPSRRGDVSFFFNGSTSFHSVCFLSPADAARRTVGVQTQPHEDRPGYVKRKHQVSSEPKQRKHLMARWLPRSGRSNG